MARNRSRKKRKKHYTKGELNRLVDSLMHPLYYRNSVFMVIDSILHGLIEQDPKLTVTKFAHYSLPKILEEILKGG